MWLNDDVRFCFTVFEDNEQYEAGDTLVHTFWKTAWPVCTTKWSYYFASVGGVFAVSTSPYFEYHNDGIDPVPVPPPPPTMRVPILGGGIYIPDNASTRFNPLHGHHGWPAVPWYQLIPTAGTLSHLLVAQRGIIGMHEATALSLYKNAFKTNLVAYFVDNDRIVYDTQHQVACADGDFVCVRNIPCITPDLTALKHIVLFTPDNPNIGIIIGTTEHSASGELDPAWTLYAPIASGGVRQLGNESLAQQPMPTTGKFTYARVTLSSAPDPGGADGYRFMLRKNGADTLMVIDITGDSTSSNALQDIDFAVGDAFNWKMTAIGAPPNKVYASWGLVYEPDTVGEAIILGGTQDTPHTTTTEQNTLTNWANSVWHTFNDAARDDEQVLFEMTLKKMAVRLEVAPGAGKSYKFTLYRRVWDVVGADTALEVNITGANKTGYDGAHEVDIDDYDCVRLKCNPQGTPALTRANWGFVAYMPQPP